MTPAITVEHKGMLWPAQDIHGNATYKLMYFKVHFWLYLQEVPIVGSTKLKTQMFLIIVIRSHYDTYLHKNYKGVKSI